MEILKKHKSRFIQVSKLKLLTQKFHGKIAWKK
jgi:hypothetical protein